MSAIFGRKKQGMKPAATGLELQTASNAVPVPIVWGRGRLAPNIIWYNNFKSRKVKVGGGKGGPSQKQWEYSVSLILGICEGPINDVNNVWKDLYYKEAGNSFKSANSAVEYLGSYSQTPWSYVTTNFPDEALSYRGVAYLGLPNYDLGTSPSMPQHSFEVNGLLYNTAVGGTEPDADPADLIWDFLTNENYGTPYLQSAISQSTLFSTVNATTTGDNTYQTYCRAMGFGLSPELTDTEEASKILERWLMLTNTAPVWSGNQLKFMPYGDETISANGVVYVPEVTVRYNLTVDDFIWSEGEDPVTYVRGDVQDAKNSFYVEVMDRDDEYSLKPVGAKDQASIEEYGKRQNVDVKAHEIKTVGMGLTIAHLLVQRSAFVRNKYRFKLPQNFILLEAMDVVTLTVEGLGLDAYRVRITVVEENDNGEIEVEAEDFPEGLGSTGTYSTQTSGGTPLNFNQAPGNVEAPIIFEPDGVLTDGTPQVWMGVTGLGAYWGGCEVWLSTDNTNYYQIGDITADQRIGKLTAALAAYGAANPDNTNTLSVDLTDSKGELESGTATDVANGANLAYVDGELLTFQTATLTAEYEYDLTTLYRGLYGTTAGAHADTTNFMYLDESVFTYNLPQEYIGQTLYLKFLSVNIFGGSVQQLSDVSAYTYTPVGTGYSLNAPTGVTITPVNTTDGSGNAQISLKVDWTASTSGLIDRYEVQVSVDGSGVWTSAPTAGGDETSSTFVGAAANTNYLARVRAVRTTGTNASSSWATSASTGSGAGASTVPDTPTSFTATGSAEANFLQWAAPATLPITGYKIYAINAATGNFVDSSLIGTVGNGTLNFIHAGLGSSDTWRYWVVAYNAAGNSTEAGPQNATTSAGGGGSVSVEDDGLEIVPAASTLNFTGSGVTVSDAGSGQVDINIPATPVSDTVRGVYRAASLVRDIYRYQNYLDALPRSSAIASVASDIITLSAAEADKFFSSYMAGASYVRVWNTSKTPMESAWVKDILSTTTLQVTDAADIAGWTATDILQIGDDGTPEARALSKTCTVDISPLLAAYVEGVTRQSGIAAAAYITGGTLISGESLQLSADGSSGSLVGLSVVGGGSSEAEAVVSSCNELSPISDSNVVVVYDNISAATRIKAVRVPAVFVDQEVNTGGGSGGSQWTLADSGTIGAATPNIDITGLAGADEILVVFEAVTASGSVARGIQVSDDNGATWYTTSGDYKSINSVGAPSNVAYIAVTSGTTSAYYGFAKIIGASSVGGPKLVETSLTSNGLFIAGTAAIDAIRLMVPAGNLTGGNYYIYTK